jgi:transposase InsO family protein
VKFAFIAAEKAQVPVTKLCKALQVSRAGFYAWASRAESQRAVEDRKLEVLVREAHERSRRTYGSPRVLAELRAQGVSIGRKRVMRIMRSAGLRARIRKRYRRYVVAEHDQPIADNLLAREFAATVPNEKWVSDTTELQVEGGRIFLAVVLDLFSRMVVGWATSAVNNRHLVLKALDMAVKRRYPDAGLLHHSDQGSPYTSEDYQRALVLRGITCSMSRRGNCYDNAAMESWMSTLKAELGERFETHAVAKEELFEYVEIFYNQQRRHSALGYVSPVEYERAARKRQVA